MANYRQHMAYQYETSPKKLRPEYEVQKKYYQKKRSYQNKKNTNKRNTKKVKKQLKPRVKLMFSIGICFMILFAISYRNSLINESFNKKENLKKELSTLQKENEQLKVNIENTLNLNNIEQAAKETLGMQKLQNEQKIYVNLPKKDYVEPATEEIVIEDQTSWIQKIINQIFKVTE